MKKILIYALTIFLLSSISSCRKYVEIEQVQAKELKKTSYFQYILNNRIKMEYQWILPIYSGDDVESTTNLNWQNSLANSSSISNQSAYIWDADYFGANEEDNQWSSIYNQIYLCNLVTNGVLGSEEGTDQEKQLINASALVHRAYAYFTLVNMYARQYDPETASQDAGVPLQLTTGLENSLRRASVKQVYDQIITDLNKALPYLPNTPDYVTNPSKMAAYAGLSRVWLNMRDFNKAEAYADSALGIRNTLLDLNPYRSPSQKTSIPAKLADPEIIFLKRTISVPTIIPINPGLLNSMGEKDLRYQIFTRRSDSVSSWIGINTERAYARHTLTNDGASIIQTGPTVPEMLLIKAECRARAGKPSDAATLLNSIRRKRFTPQDYTDLTAQTSAEAMTLIIRERRFEFMATGMRWFDMRRYDIDGLTGTVTKSLKGQTYSISHKSNRYMYPIAPKYINLNPEIEQNPR